MSFPRDAEKPIGDDGLGHEKLAEAIVLEHGCVGWEEISKTVKGAIAWRRGGLIQTLNQKIRGWCRYHDITTHSKEFGDIDNHVFRVLVKWTRFPHPRKNWTFIYRKY